MVTTVNITELENIILNEFPYPIAVRYQRMLEAKSFEIKARRGIDVYEAGLRALTLGLLGQYIQRDLETINDPKLNKEALSLITRPASLGTWQSVFFTGLKAYQGHQERFFMTQLYDFYWDTTVKPHRSQKGIQRPFQKLVELRNEISHSSPTDSDVFQSIYKEISNHLHTILQQFLFIVNYDLIYVSQQTENGYIYDIYTGQSVKRSDTLLKPQKPLREEWCYLSKETGELLSVHPLIIFWEDELSQDQDIRLPEVVIYDSYQPSQIKYWHSSAGKLETRNSNILDLFVELIIERLQSRRPRQVIKGLSWQNMKTGNPLQNGGQSKPEPMFGPPAPNLDFVTPAS